jgi:hypothetical protein
MPAVIEAKADLAELAERLRTVAEALKRLRAGNPSFSEEIERLREEIRYIAAKLRGDCPPL